MAKNTLILLALIFCSGYVIAQEDDAFKAPIITDEMTVDAEQNKDWREGNYKYSAKPKNMWELGVHVGHFRVSGDVTAPLPAGYGLGVHLRKSLGYALSYRLGVMYHASSGVDKRAINPAVIQLDYPDVAFNSSRAFRNYQESGLTGSLEILFNLGNVLFHQERNKWGVYLGAGLAYNATNISVNYRNGSENYDFSSLIANEDRDFSDVRDFLDDDYETDVENDRNVGGLDDNGTNFVSFLGSFGVSRKLSKRINLTLEHQVFIQDFDMWDGHQWREADRVDGGGDVTTDSDIANYTNLRVGINLGSFDKRTEPLYWMNPLDAPLDDISQLKLREELDLTDTDGDGVIDMIDQEINTEEGCPVDTRGVALDSDGDGLTDCKDKEVFSPYGYEIDDEGVAIIPDPGYITEDEANNIIDAKLAAMPKPEVIWALPMIHFDLDKFYVKPEFYPELSQVATVMNQHPTLRIVVKGHTDNRMSDDYNNVLAYNRAKAAIDHLVANHGIDRSRLVLQYGGEVKPLVGGLPDTHAIGKDKEYQHYLNRRVEFSAASGGESDMGRPEGPEAGKGTPSSSRPGSKYSGNRNSGY